MRAFLYRLGPWFDPRSRKPLVLLVAVALGVLLGPLAVDCSSVIFFAIPWRLRWSLGQATLVVAVAFGVLRLCRVRAEDAWPAEIRSDASGSSADRWMPWALQL